MRAFQPLLIILLLLPTIMACTSPPAAVDSNQNPSSDYALTKSFDLPNAKILHLSSISDVLIPDTSNKLQGEKTPVVHNAFLCIWADAEHLYEIATKFEQGEMDDLNGYNALLLLATLVRRMELERQNVEVPPSLAQLWGKAQEVHSATTDVIECWGYKEIDSAQVTQEIEPELITIRQVLTSTEEILVNELDVSPSVLTEKRERLLEMYSRIYVPVPIYDQEN